MEQVTLDPNGSSTGQMSIEQLESSDACLSSGDPEVVPRIGDQYQVQIPPILGKSDYALYKRNPVCLQDETGYPFNFLVGLPIPVTQKNLQVGPLNHDSATFRGHSQNSSDMSSNLGSEVSRGKYLCWKKENLETKLKPCDIPSEDGATFVAPEIENQKQRMTSHYHLVPDADVDAWSDYEKGSFVLGLYIFGKDFVQVKKFVENRRMGDILFSYYGGFYGSHEYQRWSGCRKGQNKKCVHGEKLFTGRRQQELLSRLLLSVSNECQKALLEVSKKFRAGRMGLEEYVLTLKAMVGTKILVDAVGIGKAKQDLASVALDSTCNNQVMRVKVPAGKACADLEPNEIMKFLTGDYRLSKARASGLFWEAVWPRLLARGWQSELPKREENDSLVFLVPGVEKFSRKKLEKGKQYFESVTDILRKVASEPALIELDSRDDTGNREKEDPCIAETEEQEDEISKLKHRRYLQPQTTCRKSSGMKFTVVDTSLPHGLPYELKELTDLLPIVTSKMAPSDLFEDRVESTTAVSSNGSDTDNAMLVDQTETDDSSSCLHNGKCPEMPNTKTDHAPATKHLRVLTACSQPAISSSQFLSTKLESPSSCSANHEFENVDLSSQASSHHGKTSSTTTSQGCDMECVERTPARDVHDTEHFYQNCQNMCLVDLNVPEVSPDIGTRVFMTELVDRAPHTYQKPENLNMEKTINDANSTRQQHDEVVQRRHGTRNRPPTAKSLEALADRPRKKSRSVP